MKIEDYEILRVEAKLCSFFTNQGIEANVTAEMRWRHYSGPYYMDKNNAKYFNPSSNVVLISKCSYHVPKTRPPYYRATVFLNSAVKKKIGGHTALRDYIDPIAKNMDCSVEANYSKHNGDYSRIVVSLFKNENRRVL